MGGCDETRHGCPVAGVHSPRVSTHATDRAVTRDERRMFARRNNAYCPVLSFVSVCTRNKYGRGGDVVRADRMAVSFAPPPLPIYELPPLPAEGYIWIPGYWAYDYEFGDYFWVPGTGCWLPKLVAFGRLGTGPGVGMALFSMKVTGAYLQQQEKLNAQQQKEHQKLEQQREQDHQRSAQQQADEAGTQQMERMHQQQTQQIEQRHGQQRQELQQRQAPPPSHRRPKPPPK